MIPPDIIDRFASPHPLPIRTAHAVRARRTGWSTAFVVELRPIRMGSPRTRTLQGSLR